jgi:hypothetical protein
MNRANLSTMRLSGVAAALAFAACGGSSTSSAALAIEVFSAQPQIIGAGSSGALVIGVSPSDATLTIDQGIGDVTGHTVVAITPTANTTYTLTAAKGGKTVTATTSVTVVPKPAASFKLATTATSITAGTAVTYTVTAIDATGATDAGYRGTAHFTSV